MSIPILVPFLSYNKAMLDCESMKVSAMVTDKLKPDNPYLAEIDVVLLDPPISIKVSRKPLSVTYCLFSHLSQKINIEIIVSFI